MLSSYDNIDDDFKDQLRTVIGANKQTNSPNSVAIALARLQAVHDMVDYDESDLIAKMQQEVDLKKQYERIKIEEQK